MGPDFVKRLLYVLASIIILSSAVAEEAAHASEPVVLESIDVFAGNDKPEQVVFKLSGSHTPKSFRLDGDNPRLVFDFFGVSYLSEITRIDDVGGDIIAGIRVGRHEQPQKTRVVVDIQQDSPYQHEQIFNVSNNTLVITFTPDIPQEGAAAEPESPPQRIMVGSQKVVHSTSQTQTGQQSKPTQPAAEEKPGSSQDQPGEPDVADAPVDSAAPTEPSTETATDEPEQLTPAVQPGEQAPVEEETQRAALEQSGKPAAADSTVDGAGPAEPSTDTATDAPQPLTPPLQPGEQAPAEEETQTAALDQTAPEGDVAEDIIPVLLDVSFEKSINESETVLFRLNHFYPPLVFGIEKGEPRVVCDFFDAEIDENIPPVIEARGQFVDRILVTDESDPDKIRVELVLMPNRNYDLQQLFFKEDNLFVVIVKELQQDAAAGN